MFGACLQQIPNAVVDEETYIKDPDPYFSPESLPPRPHFLFKETAATGMLNNHLGVNSKHIVSFLGKVQQMPRFPKQLEIETRALKYVGMKCFVDRILLSALLYSARN